MLMMQELMGLAERMQRELDIKDRCDSGSLLSGPADCSF